MRPCSPVPISRKHLRSDVPYPWDPAAPSWYLLCMYDLVFRTREILQPRLDILYAYTILWSEPVRSCNAVLTPNRHVRSGVSNPRDPEVPYWCLVAPSWYLLCMLELLFQTREILQPRPDTADACTIWCSEPVRSCIPTWYLVSMFNLVFRTREILQRRPNTLKAC